MSKNLELIGKRLEQFELAKLKEQYERNGFSFLERSWRKVGNEKIFADAYAVNKKTGEEIVFIVKSRNSIKPNEKERIWLRIKELKLAYQKAKVHLVFAKEVLIPSIKSKEICNLLLNEISVKNYSVISEKLEDTDYRVIEVIKESFDILDLDDFSNMNFEGEAYLILKSKSSEIEIPFSFKLNLRFSFNGKVILEKKGIFKIDFDF